jgi:hypothetical protein
LKFLLDR